MEDESISDIEEEFEDVNESLSDVSYEEDDEFDLFSDAIYAENLQIEEVLISSTINSDPPNTPAVGESSNSNSNSNSISLCEICAEERPKNEMIKIETCPHSFCSDCMTKHVTFKIRENITVVSCPAGIECNGKLELGSCRRWMPAEIVAMWEDALCESLIPDAQKYYCPFRDCSALLMDDNDEVEKVKQAECPVCHRLFCADCRVPFHLGIDCEEFQRLNEDERGSDDLMVREMATKNKWKRCPRCRYFVEKIHGCHHITCRCGFQFCYVCGKVWGLTHELYCRF